MERLLPLVRLPLPFGIPANHRQEIYLEHLL